MFMFWIWNGFWVNGMEMGTSVAMARACCNAYLALFFVRISTCSWKSVIISLCFFFKSKVVSSDSRWTSSSSLRSFSSSASRLRLASNWDWKIHQLWLDCNIGIPHGTHLMFSTTLGLLETLGHLNDLNAEIGFLALDLKFEEYKQRLRRDFISDLV